MSNVTNYKEILDSYREEENHLSQEIDVCIKQIASKYQKLGTEWGWILATEESSEKIRNLVTLSDDDDTHNKFRYEMDTTGNFYIYFYSERTREENGRFYKTIESKWKVQFSGADALERTLLEMDFNISAGRTTEGNVWREIRETSTVEGLLFSPDYVQLIRKSPQKGYGLYTALKK